MLSEDEDAMALLRRMAKAAEEIAEKISPEFPFPPSWSTGSCSEHREKPQPLCVRCNVLGSEVTLARDLYVRATNERCRLEEELRALKDALQLAVDILWDGTPASEEAFKAAFLLGVKPKRARP